MTIKEAILKSLEDIKMLTNHSAVTKHIISKGYYDFSNAQYPSYKVHIALDRIRL